MAAAPTETRPSARGWIWFEVENTPHVLFLEPLVRRVREAGYATRITGKPQSQTLALAALRGLDCESVGSGDFGRGALTKLLGGGGRAVALARWVRRQEERPRVLVSSSRSGSVAARLLGIRGMALLDYEHAEQRTLAMNGTMWLPDLLRDARLHRQTRRVARFYEGLKENLYLDQWPVDRNAERRALGVERGSYVVVARPAAESAHYASERSQALWLIAVGALASMAGVVVFVVARTGRQRETIGALLKRSTGLRFLDGVVNGPGLIAAADLVLGGGGTMNREAACLGVPAWSTFCGPAPLIDECLASEGRLRWLRSEAGVRSALSSSLPGRRDQRGPFPAGLEAIAASIIEMA